jgi:hypothetical protein
MKHAALMVPEKFGRHSFANTLKIGDWISSIEGGISMNASILCRVRAFAAFGVFVFGTAAIAQDTTSPTPPNGGNATKNATSTDGGAKSGKKAKPGTQTAGANAADKKPRAGQYASEAEARAHCHGTIVWVDQDHFNHYAGSREYGKKPGAFTCENG